MDCVNVKLCLEMLKWFLLVMHCTAVKYRVALDDGAIVAETSEEGVEFYVKDGNTFRIINCMPIHGD